MPVSVDEALQVLEAAAQSPRVQHALATLRTEMDRAPFKHGAQEDPDASRKHPFPTKDKIKELLAKDQPQPDDAAKGETVTAGERA